MYPEQPTQDARKALCGRWLYVSIPTVCIIMLILGLVTAQLKMWQDLLLVTKLAVLARYNISSVAKPTRPNPLQLFTVEFGYSGLTLNRHSGRFQFAHAATLHLGAAPLDAQLTLERRCFSVWAGSARR